MNSLHCLSQARLGLNLFTETRIYQKLSTPRTTNLIILFPGFKPNLEYFAAGCFHCGVGLIVASLGFRDIAPQSTSQDSHLHLFIVDNISMTFFSHKLWLTTSRNEVGQLEYPILDTRISVLSSVRLSCSGDPPPGFWNGVDWRALIKD